jgi:hypothetical protein
MYSTDTNISQLWRREKGQIFMGTYLNISSPRTVTCLRLAACARTLASGNARSAKTTVDSACDVLAWSPRRIGTTLANLSDTYERLRIVTED